MQWGLLITNLGTPSAPTTDALRCYLAEFLSDPYLVSLPRWVWWPLLHSLVLPFRPKRSANLYQKIWTPSGSPLLTSSKRLSHCLDQALSTSSGVSIKTVLGMRYGQPSFTQALSELCDAGIKKIIVLPLYPQYSLRTTESTRSRILDILHSMKWQGDIEFILNYSAHPSYVEALANSIHTYWQRNGPGQKLLFSFHGIPHRRNRIDPYEQHCHDTATSVAKRLHLSEGEWQVVFQSRFGPKKWLQPYCRDVLQTLAKQGTKSVDVIAPGFAVDCLETLEEIAIRYKALFLKSGGLVFNYIPALNDSENHVSALMDVLKGYL